MMYNSPPPLPVSISPVLRAVMNHDTCSTRSAAQMLGVSLRTIQLWVDGGLLQAWKTVGGHRRITVDSVRRLQAERTVPSCPEAIPAAAVATVGELPAPEPLCVLVVEDDSDLLRLYEVQIESWQPPVRLLTASNGFEGLLRIGIERPDLLVTDLAMPGMDGLRMLRALSGQAAFRQMRIAVVTGIGEAEIESRGGLPEGVLLFGKPIPFPRLRELVGEMQRARGVACEAEQ